MPDVLIQFDEAHYNLAVDNYETVVEDIQEVVTAYNLLNFAPLTTQELHKLFTGFEDLMFDKMTEGQPVSIGAFKLNRKKALEILDKPNGYETLAHKVAEVKQRFNERHLVDSNRPFAVHMISFVYEIAGDGKLSIKPNFLQALHNRYKILAKSDAAKQVFAFVQAVKKAYEDHEINKCGDIRGNGLTGFLNEVLPWRYEGSTLTIDAKKVAAFNNNTLYKKPA